MILTAKGVTKSEVRQEFVVNLILRKPGLLEINKCGHVRF